MVGWILVAVGLAMAAYAAIFGVISWEVTLTLIVVGLLDAAVGAPLIVRERRRTT
jgi:hypothetical protein